MLIGEEPTLFSLEPEPPVLPYGGTSGWSGSETSKQRAERMDRSGETARNQNITLNHLLGANLQGLTWKDLADRTGWHHGTASGVLSVLHKSGLIARLSETRNRCSIYVLPQYVQGRKTEGRRTNVSSRMLVEILQEIEHDLSQGRTWEVRRRIRATLGSLGSASEEES